MGFQINVNDVNGIVAAVAGYIERVLFMIYGKIKKMEQEKLAEDIDNG